MPPLLGFTLAIVFFLGLPAGLILLMLGLFRRGEPNPCTCGYSRSGLAAGAPCPECGGPFPTRNDIPRVRWQVNLGITLLVVSAGSALLFLVLLLRLVG